jgi:hypothetical protein
MYILHILSMFGIFIAKMHELLMCVSCVFKKLLRGRNMSFSSFLLINKSYFEREFFLLFLHDLIVYFIHFVLRS